MNPALWSLIAFIVAVALSCTSRINVGLIALALSWLLGSLVAGLRPEAVAGGFPAMLFVTLVGVTLLFALAEQNGTLEAVARRFLSALRDPRFVPPLIFVLAAVLSGVGPGAVAATALMAPLAMAIGLRAGASAFLVALMIANGANAGNLSSLSAVGIIARDGMAKAGLLHHEGKVFFANFAAHLIVGGAAWLWLRRRHGPSGLDGPAVAIERLTVSQGATLGVLALWILGTLLLSLPVGFAAFVAASALILGGAADERAALRSIPWAVIVMVTGMTTLVSVLEKTGGMALVTALLAALATPATVNGMVAFVTGAISTWSSTSGVVMPAFLPTSSALAAQVGGGDPFAIALSINVGSSLVDVSPLSTIGALCVAAVSDPEAARDLFRKLMIWGLSMIVVGALLSQLAAGPLARM
ncbi:MAG: C4-dicarboxylate ABC transporter [Vicinamibacteria bacterium]|nr:C4-dicarboxylate ABC transporter [Vicinamibacteria bacterium]